MVRVEKEMELCEEIILSVEIENTRRGTMKHNIKTKPALCAAAFCAVALACPSAKANVLEGSIGFEASGITADSPNLATATSFTVISPTTSEETGAYLSVPTFTPVTMLATRLRTRPCSARSL